MENSKGILFKLTFLLILACAACARSTHKVTYYLTQAEELVWTSPDSALQLLKSIPTPEKLTGKEQADYALLLTLTQYRCNIPISSDSLVNLAVEYYKDKNNADKKGEALYVRGCLLEEIHKDISNALIAYKEAEKCIPYMKKAYVAARIYSNLGYLNKNSFNFELAKEYYKKALQANMIVQDTVSQASDLLNLSTIYYALHQVDSTDWCINHLKEMAKSINDSVLQAKIYNNIANRKIFEKKYVEAEKYLIHAIRVSPTYSSAKISLGLAKLYMNTAQKEKSDSLFTCLLSCPDLLVRANIYLDLLNSFLIPYPTEQSYFNNYIATVDSVYKENRTKELGKIQQKYDNEVLARANDQLRFKWILSIVIGIVFASILGTFLCKKWRRMSALQKQIEELESKKDTLIYEYENSSQQKDMHYAVQIKELEKQINDLNNEKRRLKYSINNILKAKEENTEDDYAGIFKTYLSITRQKVYNSDIERINLHHWLNYTNHNFADKLAATYPKLSGRSLDVCYLTALNLSIKDIAALLKVDERTIERYMSNICKEAGHPKGGKNIFVSIIRTIIDSEE